jgi:multiple sugar transport system substrate-binding protein
MRIIRVSAVAAAATAVLTLAACGGGSSTGGSGGGNTSSGTITYWASNQGASLQADYNVLNPELLRLSR